MRNISGSTASETKLIKAIQKSVNAIEDGSVGAQTMSDIAMKLNSNCFPLTINIYNNPVIICKDIIPFQTKAPLSNYKNSISGTFNNGTSVCSILVTNGKIVYPTACHWWEMQKPESVLYKTTNGIIGCRRVKNVYELPTNLKWALGGLGLLNLYNPSAEGFAGKFSDVLRKTNHTVIGSKGNYIFLCYAKDMTATQVNNYVKKLKLDYAVMLDGGHYAAINGEETFAKINLNQRQLCVVQADGGLI